MSVSVLILTHDGIGTALLKAAIRMFGNLPTSVTTVPVSNDCDTEAITANMRHLITQIDKGDGVLILTDLYGSTPCNIANNVANHSTVQVISGISLPMLVRVLNYASLSISELCQKALSGGQEGVIQCR